jgi:hypothetical protein
VGLSIRTRTQSIEGGICFARSIFCFWGVDLSVPGLAFFVHGSDMLAIFA